jgi:hypothetical protein
MKLAFGGFKLEELGGAFEIWSWVRCVGRNPSDMPIACRANSSSLSSSGGDESLEETRFEYRRSRSSLAPRPWLCTWP